MNLKVFLLILLCVLAALINLHPPQVFFDQQLMLGASLAMLALLQFGWAGMAVGICGYLITWYSWGHPFELINGCCWLVAIKLFLDRFNGGRAYQGNGRVVLATIAYWSLIGLPAEWIWFQGVLGMQPSEALGIGLKELVMATVNSNLGLLLYAGLQLLSPRQRQRGLLVRGLTVCTLLLAISLPGLLITVALSHQLRDQTLRTTLEAMQHHGRTVLYQSDAQRLPSASNTPLAVRVEAGRRKLINSNPALFQAISTSYQPERKRSSPDRRLILMVPRQKNTIVEAHRISYWQTSFEDNKHLITVLQPAAPLIHQLAFEQQVPIFSMLAGLLIGGALFAELIGSLVNAQFQDIIVPWRPHSDEFLTLMPSRSFIRELNQLSQALRRNQQQLIKSEERYRNFFNLPLVGTAITSRSKGWIDVNQATCDLLGYPRDELMRKDWAELTHPDDLAADMAQFERMLRREINGYQLEKRFIRKDGTTIYTLLAGGCGDIGPMQPDLFYVNIIDISETKRLEAELSASIQRERMAENQQRNLLEQKLKTSLTAAAIVHEIKQPLAAILLNSRLALKQLNAPTNNSSSEQLTARLSQLITSSDQVVSTMERMRMLLRNVETRPIPLDLSATLKTSLMYLKKELRQNQISFSSEGLEGACPYLGDSGQLQIAVVNLIRNAMEAMEEQPPSQRLLHLALEHQADQLTIRVADSGPGFPKTIGSDTGWEVLKSTKAVGMGIGLFLVQTAVSNHKGWLQLGRSASLGGGEVVITLPRSNESLADVQVPPLTR